MASTRKIVCVIGVLVACVAVVAAYRPALEGGFIWDDEHYVYGNSTLTDDSGLWNIWTDPTATPQYYPLVHTTYWLEYRIWELDPAGYHWVNLILHLATAVLIWRVLRGLDLKSAWAVALVFAIHPVHVESVAWITERKNVLSGLLWASSLFCYLKVWASEGDGFPNVSRPQRKWLWQVGCWTFFLLALLSKSVAFSLPAVFLLLRWWKQGRLKLSDLLMPVPMLLVGIASGMLTTYLEAEHVGASGELFDWSLRERFVIAARALWFYPAKILWPHPLVFFYPKWPLDWTLIENLLAVLTAFSLPVVLVLLRHRIGRGPATAILFYGGTVLPAVGFINIYPMRYSYVADHFQYLASLGIIVLVLELWFWIWRRSSDQDTSLSRVSFSAVGPVVTVLLFAACLWPLTHAHAKDLANLESVYRHTLKWNPQSTICHNNLGIILRARGDLQEATDHFQQALDGSESGTSQAEANLLETKAEILLEREEFDAAIQLFQQAIEVSPQFHRAYFQLGRALQASGETEQAIAAYLTAIQLGRNYPSVFVPLAEAFESMGRWQEAALSYTNAVRGGERSPSVLSRCAWLLAAADDATRNGEQARALAEAAWAADQSIVSMVALAAAHAECGAFAEAVQLQQKALAEAEAQSRDLRKLRELLHSYQDQQPARIANGAALPD